eukprot:CAMPEP_0197829906 /NCGR_PEP_ID=MMETSP1437-20131217/6462_1 /TAXON_ID=49252 ORGANISM="Eucampia antarctica, Strain CCMP1452" /NCGR_SAMPLE_ID=MMETSP1437 /ASSEMBLY_ACC=CAM_ASM_001096 /LENGTH=220 /DNA_ID=CAMNT_0043431921 /DNA_START=658 /DNA_END=1320 /DNA_ORIENTATION=+
MGKLESRDSRKIIHTFSAPFFLILWPLYSSADGARYFASIAPLLQALTLWLAARGGEDASDEELANTLSRGGDAEEVLGGPFIYVVVLLCSILGFWTNNLVGIMAVTVMAIGDGLADIVGRRWGANNKWFFSPSKSVAGSLAFVIGSSLGSIALVSWLAYTNTIILPSSFGIAALAARIVLICSICAFVELLPIVDDNLSVPIAAAILTSLFLYLPTVVR